MTIQQELHTILVQGLDALSLELSERQQQQLVDYVLLMDKWNKACRDWKVSKKLGNEDARKSIREFKC